MRLEWFQVTCCALRVYPSLIFYPKRRVKQFVVFVNMQTLENKMYLVSGIKFSVPALNYTDTFRPHEIALLSIHFHQRFGTGNNLGIQVLQSSTHLSKCSLYYCVYPPSVSGSI